MGCAKKKLAMASQAAILAKKPKKPLAGEGKPSPKTGGCGHRFSGYEVTGSGKDARKMRRTEQKPK